MKPLALSSGHLAHAINVTPAHMNEIINEKRGITAQTALRLATYFGTDAESWMNLQQNYDLECARRALRAELGHIHPHTL
ncbi:putative HTH-type transcriptional regulator YbaQ [Dyella sp. AD56]|uniref:HigA family addiction module antitoxin n=1 Tax=Dyella sp. AD56 TaxID=1528744 RepID=UPI000C83BA1C|nr:HigA family addiction module antitoxin [Dyella sp. AD56]PMQ03719.1 putative HTH-type transcriptional regulator YbaQ [Dyella sp. AD56]